MEKAPLSPSVSQAPIRGQSLPKFAGCRIANHFGAFDGREHAATDATIGQVERVVVA
jgi:hypothetical protein